jgi:beta-phosphoglucomutase
MKQVEGCIFNLDDIIVDTKQGEILPGVKRFLIDLRISGMKLAVTTKKNNDHTLLEDLNICDFFDSIECSKNNGLDTEPLLLKSAENICVNPENCVVFCTEEAFLQKAKEMNMGAICVGTSTFYSLPDKIVPNLSSINSSILNFN